MQLFRSSWLLSLLCLTLFSGYAAETNSVPEKPKVEAEVAGKALEKQMLGVTLVADVDMERIDRFRTLGMSRGFGENQPLCDFIATEKWVKQRGSVIRAGEKIRIGKATLVETPDGFGNTGTKLVLDSDEPKAGLVFYCYAFNRAEKAYWAIDKKQIAKALAGSFHLEK